jgi:hypothetical protein
MKNIKKRYLLSLFSFLLLGSASMAQVSFDHIGIGLSHWNRTYAGADERSFLPSYPGDGGFSQGSMMPQLTAAVHVAAGIGVDARVGLWNATFSGEAVFANGLRITETLSQQIIPLTAGVYYSYENLVPEKLNVHLGVGVNRYFVQNEVERLVAGGEGSLAPSKFTGNDYGSYVKVGVEYLLAPKISLVLDGRYNSGSYSMSYVPDSGAALTQRSISLQGMEVGLSLRYLLKSAASANVKAPADGEKE